MAYYDLSTINNAIETTLATATGINRSQGLSEITDSLFEADLPLLQVLPQTWTGAAGSQTQNNTFGGKGTNATALKRKQWTFNIYVYISTYARFREGVAKLAEIAAAITEVLDSQEEGDLFGEEAVRSFTYTAERGVLPYSEVNYVGISITLVCEIW